ncbi:hypothetical protein HDU96_004828 [Phlyctochytrium bullatum]|nr:hypothetical protein HDU96_004828 [Phlyctochytrium bullatum]
MAMIRRPQPPFALPFEVWTRVFSHLDVNTPRAFIQACRFFKLVADDPHGRCAWFLTKYGKPLALLQAFRNHRLVLTPEVGKLMVSAGCGVPRFLIQWVDKEYHRPERSRRSVSAGIFVFFVNAGYLNYGMNADFKEDDIARFERCVYNQNSTATETVETLKTLIDTYKFVPVRGFGSPIDETVYLVSKIDLRLVRGFIRNGLDIDSVNDMVMERVLWRPDISNDLIQSYVSVGFSLTPPAIKKGLQMARPSTLDVLRARVPPQQLQKLAEETIYDMFGPSIRGWTFTPEALDFLTAAFPIGEDVMERAILRVPSASADAPDAFPATRCYMKANPCPAWRWILRNFGPTHRFTMASFDDAISRAAADRDLHSLHDVFLEAGVQFRPRHVKILACRVLHRDMTANALHLLQVMRTQVTTNYRDLVRTPPTKTPAPSAAAATATSGTSYLATPPSSPLLASAAATLPEPTEWTRRPSDGSNEPEEGDLGLSTATPRPTHADLQTWIRHLKDEITENDEWDQRMRTTQLEGGPRGGAYRITRPPEDAVRFLDEAKGFVADLTPPPPPPAPISSMDRKGKRFRASVVVGGMNGRQGPSSPPSPSSPTPSRPIVSLARRSRGNIVRRNSAPIPGAENSRFDFVPPGQGAASTSTAPVAPQAPEIAPAAEEAPVDADEAAEVEDEENAGAAADAENDDDGVADQPQPLADDAPHQPPTTPGSFRRPSRSGHHLLPNPKHQVDVVTCA